MEKILKITLSIVLMLYMVFLWKYLLIEEIIGLYLIPVIIAAVIAGLCFLPIRIFKPIKYKKIFAGFLVVACILQVGILYKFFHLSPSQSFTKEQVTDDIDFAVKMLEDVHPDPYSIISKEDFYRKVDSMKKMLPEIVSDKDASKTFGKIYALIKDGHTRKELSFNFPVKFLPYKFKIMDERIFVARNFGYRNLIPIGSEIISINGKSSQQYLQEISHLFSWDNISFRNISLQYPILYSLWDDCRNYKVTYKTPEGKTKSIRTSGGLFSLLQLSKGELGQLGIRSNYQYKSISDSIAYIEFNSFTDLEQFKIFLDSTFTAIKKENVKHLIIDIRQNGGGNSSLGDELMQYISKKDFIQFETTFVKISDELMNKKRLEHIDSAERKVGTIYRSDAPLIELRDNPLRFTGKSYLLVGGNTFSSASSFTSAFQCFEVGAIIGSETGGLTVCFGDVYSFKLPETNFNMGISYKKFYQACGKDDRRGIIPDYIVENTIEDDLKSFDRVLDFTLDLIKKNNLTTTP